MRNLQLLEKKSELQIYILQIKNHNYFFILNSVAETSLHTFTIRSGRGIKVIWVHLDLNLVLLSPAERRWSWSRSVSFRGRYQDTLSVRITVSIKNRMLLFLPSLKTLFQTHASLGFLSTSLCKTQNLPKLTGFDKPSHRLPPKPTFHKHRLVRPVRLRLFPR